MSGIDDLIAASAESLMYEDINFTAGATWNTGWSLWDSAKTPVNFTTMTATCEIKDRPGGQLLASWTNELDNGAQVVLANGSVSLEVAASTTRELVDDDYRGVYEIELVSGNKVLKLVRGIIVIRKEIVE